ncbi:triose-phosphate isomerase [candidate division WOR-3 bacterium JGI_Cruoil_03_51_56]|uniref:Triosephosphate isomerase n=1 Tax=candidate division WOR-3 bacterium JGI_Cruoil_03_51_56 TaxID=1973747 RepID=A0A235BWB5_UNCW3|nr:MAG: triose-phosphate isomerase [candidate division WOR-3 bacterium JGI_Cruoil_03_51_56]
MNSRIPIIAGNWKMNKTPSQARAFAIELKERLKDVTDRKIVIFPPFTALSTVASEFRQSRIAYGGQNFYWENSGAFTGEIAPQFLTDLGCTYVLVGHSERRYIFNESDEACQKKIRAALKSKLVPFLCCGETLKEKEAEKTLQAINRQLSVALAGIGKDDNFVIAYEPVWAIGTGKTATPPQANETHKWIRNWLSENISPDTAQRTRILYGGSVKPDNIDNLMAQNEIDGALVGTASLDIDSFERLVRFRS